MFNLKTLVTSAMLAMGLALALPASAELVATPLSGDARLVTFDFDPDNTYLILTKPRAVTHLEFPGEERIVTLAAGDTANFEFTPTKDRRHLFVRARIENASTSMTVITDKRSFQFVVRATYDGAKWYQRVTWRVPQTLLFDSADEAPRASAPSQVASAPASEASPVEGVRPEDLRFNYHIEGDAPFKPVSIFDNGKMTWLRMAPGLQELPVVFALDEAGEFQLVNYVPKGDYLVVQRTMPKFVLRIGKAQVTVSKTQPKKSWFGFSSDQDASRGN